MADDAQTGSHDALRGCRGRAVRGGGALFFSLLTLPVSAHALSVPLPQAKLPAVSLPTSPTTAVRSTATATADATAAPSVPSPPRQSTSAPHQPSAAAPQST